MAVPADARKRAEEPPAARPRRAGVRARQEDARFERLVYERVRLGMMGALAARDELSFSELKELFQVSDGNLSAHARKLEEAGYVSCSKSFADRRPRTAYRLTPTGRSALNRYLDHVEAVIRATRRR
jgi:DNA-binding MarR family transcriptional regulator